MSGDILDAGVNVEEQEDYGYTGSFKKKHIILDDSTKNKSTKININPMLNIDEQQLNDLIYKNMDEKEKE